jgi:hypothetical protein
MDAIIARFGGDVAHKINRILYDDVVNEINSLNGRLMKRMQAACALYLPMVEGLNLSGCTIFRLACAEPCMDNPVFPNGRMSNAWNTLAIRRQIMLMLLSLKHKPTPHRMARCLRRWVSHDPAVMAALCTMLESAVNIQVEVVPRAMSALQAELDLSFGALF